MKRLAIFVLISMLACTAAAPAENPQQKPKEMRGQGCVEPGIEARCLLVKDMKTAKIYHLIFKGLQPALGEGIEFVALPHNGPTSCMQGIPLDVVAWERRDQFNCKPAAPRKK